MSTASEQTPTVSCPRAILAAIVIASACADDGGPMAADTDADIGSSDATEASSSAPTSSDPSATEPTTGASTVADDSGSSDGGTTGAATCTVEVVGTYEAQCVADPSLLVAGPHAALVWSVASPGGRAEVLRFDADGGPIGDPLPVGVSLHSTGMRDDGAVGISGEVGGEIRLTVATPDGASSGPTFASVREFDASAVEASAQGWLVLQRHTSYEPEPHALIDLHRLAPDGAPVGAPERLADLGDDLGFESTVLVPYDGGMLAAWSDYVPDRGAWFVDARHIDGAGAIGGQWSTALGAVLACGWAQDDGWVLCARGIGGGHLERRSLDSGAPQIMGFAGAGGEMVVAAARDGDGAVALAMTGGFGDGGATTVSAVRLDADLQPSGAPILVADEATRGSFAIASIGATIVTATCQAPENDELVVTRIVCD